MDKAQIIHEGQDCLIYLIENKTNKEIVKVLQNDSPNYQGVLAYLQNEYDLSKNLDRKGVRRAFKLDTFENNPALFLEYIEGENLRKSPLSGIKESLKVGIEIAKSLAFIHQNNIIHKDLNPNNVLINPRTQEVTIIDFGISSRVSQKKQHLGNPKHLEGTLKYISPEQTGRVNKVVDYRTDLYSLGIILYELLVGHTPFDFADPMELVHAHIASKPKPSHEIKPEIPLVLSTIILKLLEKNADERYQTALGLQYDLEKCLEQLENTGKTESFDLGQKDLSGRLQIPQKLYGREGEVKVLLEAFERISHGGKGFLLVGGYSGVGKSALVNEIHKPITEKRGYFISGKFDQFQRNIPYYALRKAFSELIGYWLGEDEKTLEKWRQLVKNALGDLANVVTEIIPELELLIGETQAVAVLEGDQYANRFNYVFGLFINTICTPEHPLVMFIDDWQWADSASLGLFKTLLADETLQNILFIGAYRNNEVDETHPFIQTLKTIEESKITPVERITLKNLSINKLQEWLTDTFKQDNSQSLSDLVYEKTAGNAFFTTQFVQTLFEEGLLQFSFEEKKWVWDIEQIRNKNITDNVVELMSRKIQKLDTETQELLQIGSCVGASFEISLLADISQETEEKCRKVLEEALVAGLLSKTDLQTYRFIHDRIQQASYQLIPDYKRKALHYQIGKVWLKTVSETEKEDKIMDIVSQLNFGLDLIKTEEEKNTLFELNLQAGKKAKNSVAYASAYYHFSLVGSLLAPDAWIRHYERTFDLYKNWSESAFLANEKEVSLRLFKQAIDKSQNIYHKAEIYAIQIRQRTSEGKYLEACDEGISALNLFGYELPRISDQEFYTQKGMEELGGYLQTIQSSIPITEIENIPLLTDRDQTFCLRIIGMMLDGVFLGAPYAYLYTLLKGVNISLKYGQSGYLPFLLTNMGVIHSSMKDYKSSYIIAMVALKMKAKYDLKEADARFYHILGYDVLYADTFRKGIEYQLNAFTNGLEVGDLAYGGYGLTVAARFSNPLSLNEMLQHTLTAEAFFQRSNNPILLLANHSVKGYILNIQGKTFDKLTFSNEQFEEQKFVDLFTNAAPTWIAIYKRLKIQSLVLWGAYPEAQVLVEERAQWLGLMAALDAEYKSAYYVFATVTVSSLFQNGNLDKTEAETVINEAVEELKLLEASNPDLFGGMYQIILAKKAILDENPFAVMNHYDEAIRLAASADLTLYAALANELAAKFYSKLGKNQFANLYATQAVNFYRVWGADAKANSLEEQYVTIHRKTTRKSETTFIHSHNATLRTFDSRSTGSTSLDMETLLKASQTLSKEIYLESLLQKMLRILIENAGADKGILFLEDHGQWFIQGEIYADGREKVLHALLLADAKDLVSSKAINYVLNSKKLFVVNSAQDDTRIEEEKRKAFKSLLCLPIINQNKLTGLLYLENSLIEGAFSSERVNLLSSLASQIAISIENAVLYENLEAKVAERTESLAKSKIEIEKQHRLLENVLQDLQDSINYAKRIQSAILPRTTTLRNALSENFVFYMPRDVVSGDFYWTTEINIRSVESEQTSPLSGKLVHKKQIFVVADCTGHGVPGAFMSMIGINLLNQIVTEKQIHQPNLILGTVDSALRVLLKQNDAGSQDGMDMALVTIDKENKILEFAGAKRPLIYFKNGEMTEIKGIAKSIGGHDREIAKFEKHTISTENTTFYIFSDGYPDQIGGEQSRKFLIRNFRILLSKIHGLPMSEQQNILANTLEQWIGTGRQIDDILVAGFRIG